MQSIIANYYFQQESLRYIINVILVVTWGGGEIYLNIQSANISA